MDKLKMITCIDCKGIFIVSRVHKNRCLRCDRINDEREQIREAITSAPNDIEKQIDNLMDIFSV